MSMPFKVMGQSGAGGGGGVTLQLIASEYTTEAVTPSTSQAQFSMNTAGGATGQMDLVSGSLSYNWRVNGTSSDYEVRATLTSGTFTSGTAGSWLALSTSRTWTVSRTTTGTKSATATFEIRRVADSVVVAGPASITLNAVVTL